MEVRFDRRTISCLDTALRQVQNSEQTMELRLQEEMPDIGRVLTAWGQPILRSKEWMEEEVQCTGGMMIWVLYGPEDGSDPQWLQGWIPFQLQWDLPEHTQEGILRLHCLTRFVDARNTSPRKMMIRAGLSVMAEAFVPGKLETAESKTCPENTELLQNTYPVRLQKEAGEKSFRLEESLYLPDSAPKIEKLVTWSMHPRILDQRILADKVVLRGNGNLHVLYRSDSGQFHCWNFEVPYSQYVDLRGEYSADARSDIAIMPTTLELELQENGSLDLRSAMTAQYLITDKELLNLVEDAYSPERELILNREELTPTVVLENRRENIYGEQSMLLDVNMPVDVQFLPEFPRQHRTDSGVELENSGCFHVLYYGADGNLHGADTRWEGSYVLAADENSRITAVPVGAEVQAIAGNGKLLLKAEIPMEWTTTAVQTIPVITGIEAGQQKQSDPDRPSLILRRAGQNRLWDIAKSSGSTMEAILRVNGLSGEPAPEQMLLIPVP